MSNLIEAIKCLFATEYEATKAKYGNYDPFAGHSENDHKEGKSYFFSDINRKFGSEFGAAKAVVLSEATPDPDTKILTIGFEWPDPDEPFEREHVKTWERHIDIGNYVVTMDEYPQAELKIRPNHGELQFFGRKDDWWLMETGTATATVILNREDGKWLLATAFPGPAGVHNDQKVLEKLAKATNLTAELAMAFDCNLNNVILKSDEDFEEL